MNLFYQCTQNNVNNYALNHFGGEKRSFERWLSEFIRCNVRLHENIDCKDETDAWWVST